MSYCKLKSNVVLMLAFAFKSLLQYSSSKVLTMQDLPGLYLPHQALHCSTESADSDDSQRTCISMQSEVRHLHSHIRHTT